KETDVYRHIRNLDIFGHAGDTPEAVQRYADSWKYKRGSDIKRHLTVKLWGPDYTDKIRTNYEDLQNALMRLLFITKDNLQLPIIPSEQQIRDHINHMVSINYDLVTKYYANPADLGESDKAAKALEKLNQMQTVLDKMNEPGSDF